MRSPRQYADTHCASSCYPKQRHLWDFSEGRSHTFEQWKTGVLCLNTLTQSCRRTRSRRGRYTCCHMRSSNRLRDCVFDFVIKIRRIRNVVENTQFACCKRIWFDSMFGIFPFQDQIQTIVHSSGTEQPQSDLTWSDLISTQVVEVKQLAHWC